jgi:tetratricopeptide (TPR) repeat protein
MPEISNKKKKFIKKNFKRLSIEELTCQTGLRPNVINSLINEYSTRMPGKEQPPRIENGALIPLSWKIILSISLLFAVVAIITYYPSLHGDFIFDGKRVIQDSPLSHIERLSQITDLLLSKEIGRRIGLISFALNFYFGGLDPFGYHLVNVIIHILNGLVLFILSYKILTLPLWEGRWKRNALKISFLGSFIWLVHPIQTQAVSYIVQRLTSLSALFFLLAFLCYIQGRLDHAYKQKALFFLSFLFGLLALGTKQNTATLPLFIVLSEFLFFQQKPLKTDGKRLGLILLLGGIFILITVIYLGSDFIPKWALSYEKRGWTPLERVLTELRVVILYMSLLVYPHPSRLCLDYDFPVSHSLFSPFTTFLSLLVIVGLLVFAIFVIKKNRLVSFAILWFFGNLVIESSIIPLELVFEHRVYLPSMGIIILVSGLCFAFFRREQGRWITVLILFLILLFSYWTYKRAFLWGEPIRLWVDAAIKSPHKARPHHNMGLAYYKEGKLDEAATEYKKALAINPNHAMAHTNLGLIYVEKKRFDEAISELKKALVINPTLVKAYNNLGHVYYEEGKLDEAAAEYKKALALDPNYTRAHYNLGLIYSTRKRFEEAIAEYKKALAGNPNFAEVHNNLAVAYYSTKNYKLAVIHCDRAMELGFKIHPKLLKLLRPHR